MASRRNRISVLFLAAVVLFAAHTIPKRAAAKGGDDVDWGGTSGNDCDSSQHCHQRDQCCVKVNGKNTCSPLAHIGQRCSNTKYTNADVYIQHCPCVQPFTCAFKDDSLSICEAPKGRRK